jgi:hypothetical protein
MSVALLESAFVAGELSASVAGRFDVARIHVGAFTMRNFYVSYKGGAYSRAGTAFVGFSRQTGRSYPPRMIPFQDSINQGLALEFGNYYMRVVFNGAFVTESPFEITGITNANPAVVSYVLLSTATSAVAINSGVTSSYVRGDTVTPAGGTAVTIAVFQVVNTTLAKVNSLALGTSYAVNDTIVLAGGTSSLAPVLTVTAVNGSGGITGFVISNGGSFTTNGSGSFTQASTSGAGTGATFSGGLFGPNTLSVYNPGGYTALPANPANQASSSGGGLGAQYTITWATPGPLASADWVFLSNVTGMTQVNGQTYVINNVTPTQFTLADVYGNPINSTAFGTYTAGGLGARIYTLTTPYSEVDLPYLKFTQSADVMSLCCVNQMTDFEYAPLDLTRTTDTNWSFSDVVPGPSILPPPALSGAASTTGSVDYNYVVTSVNPADGTESVASPIADIPSAVDIASTAGSITLTWTTVVGASSFNVYKATPAYAGTVPAGSLFGFVGSAYGTQFVDSNIVADDTQVPPTHQNPFARGQILSATVTNGGSSASFAITINTLTGSGAVLTPVVVSNVLVAIIVQEPGQNYLPTDTLTINHSATAKLQVGAQSGTYPSLPGYFQERRAYANTLNNPDTYFMSQPGAFTNFDTRNPTIDSDAITGSPWSVEVNGIQWMIQTSGGLLVLTGLSAWLLVGAGSFATNVQAISPSTQDAVPQAFTGASSTVPPNRINYDVIYLNSKSTTYYDLPYQLYALSEPIDLTENSSQLFVGYTIRENAWCETPYKIMWAVRNDGILLSLTYYKTQQVAGWARHDTNGLFVSVCSVTEPPIDALYIATQRYPGGSTAYMIERMNSRIWNGIEDSWCVDAALAIVQPTPNATLSASSATGLGSITGVTGLIGGANYSAFTTATIVDENVNGYGPGPGSGAVPTLTIVGGVITGVTFSAGNQGSGYLYPMLIISDPTNAGSGASALPILNNSMTFSASGAVFSNTDVGSVIRMGEGIATITDFTDSQHVTGNIITPIVGLVPNSGGSVEPAAPGNWTMTAPVTVISGLNHLIGATVTGLADGNVIAPQVVTAQGTITLAKPASSVVVGLAYLPQLQSVFLDEGQPTVQGQRKKISAVTARIEASRGFKVGSNMPDGSRLNPQQVAPVWYEGPGGLTPADLPGKLWPAYNSTTTPLFTGDIRLTVGGGYDTRGQVAVQQDNPLPCNILAFIPEAFGGDTTQLQAPKQQGRGR